VEAIARDEVRDGARTYNASYLAGVTLGAAEGGADENVIIKMAMVHDIGETRVSDLNYIQKVYVKPDEESAARDLFAGTLFSDFEDVLNWYEARDSLEAKLVKDANNLDVDIELKELANRGSQLPKKWEQNRLMVRNTKLYPSAAKTFWNELQSSDPASWHLSANKWERMPDVGK